MQPCGFEERAEIGLFELWMGITPEEWDALGDLPSADDMPAQPDLI
jgi:hypothetical protein